MGKILVVYKSKYGVTEEYAEWIARELGADIFPSSNVSKELLEKYSVIVFGGGLYASRFNGLDIIKKNHGVLKNKKTVIFSSGLSDPDNEKIVKKIRDGLLKELPEDLREKVTLFHVPGGVRYAKLNFIDGLIIKMIKKMLGKNTAPGPEEKSMLEILKKDFASINTERAKPIVEFCGRAALCE